MRAAGRSTSTGSRRSSGRCSTTMHALGCHASNGRGLSQIGNDFDIDINGANSQSLIRCSLVDGHAGCAGRSECRCRCFGTQLQDHAVGALAEVHVTLAWEEQPVLYADNTMVMLRAAEPRRSRRPMDSRSRRQSSRRIARRPPIIGLGLLEAIDEATLEALADPDDADGDGISGRINHVWDPVAQATETGRFGWKANHAELARAGRGRVRGRHRALEQSVPRDRRPARRLRPAVRSRPCSSRR